MNEHELEARAKADAAAVFKRIKESQWLIVVMMVVVLGTVVFATAILGYSIWLSFVFGVGLALVGLVGFYGFGERIITSVARWSLRSRERRFEE